jgi:hypothetical protein
MDLRPWQLWTRDGKPSDVTEDVVRVLESVLQRDPRHPGANHYYIHTMEGSPQADKALAAAKRLETLVPAAGHLVHMPAHIYARTGRFVASAEQQRRGRRVDERYMKGTTRAAGMYPLMYYNHNVHFESYAAAMAGAVRAREADGRQAHGERHPVHRRHADDRRVHPAAVLRAAALSRSGTNPGAARARGRRCS